MRNQQVSFRCVEVEMSVKTSEWACQVAVGVISLELQGEV